MTKDEKFMLQAIKQAEKSVKSDDWGMGCVIVHNNKIISRGYNTGFSDKNRLAHAELKALIKARRKLEKLRGKATLYSTYSPCPMCFGAILAMKIRRLVIGVDLDKSGGHVLNKHLPPFYKQKKFKLEIKIGVLAKECKEVCMKSIPAQKHFKKLPTNINQLES